MGRLSADMRIKEADRTRKNIIYMMTIREKTPVDIAEYMMLNIKTVQKKLENPQKFTYEELLTLAAFLNSSVGFLLCGKIVFEQPKLEA